MLPPFTPGDGNGTSFQNIEFGKAQDDG
jgi:hypothetical protein